jgi:hypothetical protein
VTNRDEGREPDPDVTDPESPAVFAYAGLATGTGAPADPDAGPVPQDVPEDVPEDDPEDDHGLD